MELNIRSEGSPPSSPLPQEIAKALQWCPNMVPTYGRGGEKKVSKPLPFSPLAGDLGKLGSWSLPSRHTLVTVVAVVVADPATLPRRVLVTRGPVKPNDLCICARTGSGSRVGVCNLTCHFHYGPTFGSTAKLMGGTSGGTAGKKVEHEHELTLDAGDKSWIMV